MPSPEPALSSIKTNIRDELEVVLAPLTETAAAQWSSASRIQDCVGQTAPSTVEASTSEEEVSAARALLSLTPSKAHVTPPKVQLMAQLQFIAETSSKTLCDDHTPPKAQLMAQLQFT